MILLFCWGSPGDAAGGPGGGGGSGGGTGGGAIYFTSGGLFRSMNSDGTGKTVLGISGLPSFQLHDGHRWIISGQEIVGHSYPNGMPRVELFALRDDGQGDPIQLTDDPDVEWMSARWAPGDAAISWVGRRWDNGNVVEGGIYAGAVTFAGGEPLPMEPVSLLVSMPLVQTNGVWEISGQGTLGPDVAAHDWAPSRTAVVYQTRSNQLWVADLNLQHTTMIVATGSGPAWSPDGLKIAFQAGFGGNIEAVRPDGMGRTTIIAASSTQMVSGPLWSPTGTHLIYTVQANSKKVFPKPLYIYRATATGGSRTNLTGEFTYSATVAWR